MTKERVHFTTWLLCLFLLWVPLTAASAASSVVWDQHSNRIEVSRSVEYWQETDAPADFQAVQSMPEQNWTGNDNDSISLGFVDHAYWFRFRLENASDGEAEAFLEIRHPILDRIEIYLDTAGAGVESLVVGDKQPFHDRPVHHRNFVVPIKLAAGERANVFLRVKTTSSMQVPLVLWDQDSFYVAKQAGALIEGLYYGIVMVMIFYNLFVFIAVGERSFLYYVGYITAVPLVFAGLHGTAFQYLWPQATWWNDQAIVVFLNLAVLLGCIFSIRFLNASQRNHPRFNRLAVVMIMAAGLLAVAGLFAPYEDLILPSIMVAVLACSTMLVLSMVRWNKGDPAARYYTVAWVFMLAGGILLAMSRSTVLPRNLFTENAAQVGSAIGVILLSLALADRLNKEKKRGFEVQQRLLREERKARMAQDKSLRVQRESNALLEQRVHERTRDLKHLNEQLLELSATDALTGLKNRGHFDRTFQSAVVHAFRYEQSLSLLVLDIDHFKKFNDTFGHLVGDDCLKMVAGCIRRFVTRPQDLAARYGGEEFVVMLPDTPTSGAVRVAERIRGEIEKTAFRVSGEQVHLTISVGVCSVTPSKADATKEIFKRADEALYEAKGRGRNGVVVWTAGDQAMVSATTSV